MTKIKNNNSKYLCGCGETWLVIHRWWEHKMTHSLWKKSRTISYKNKCAYHTTWQLPSWAFIPEKWNLCSHKNLYMNVNSSFIGNSQKLITTPMSFTGWMVKQSVVHPYHEMLLSKKRNKVLIHATTYIDCSRELCWVKKSQSQKITYCMISFI